MRCKYVCIKSLVDTIIVFPEIVEHADMVPSFGPSIISAGFIDMNTYECYGKSVSLGGTPSRGEIDTRIAIRQFVDRD